MRKNVCHHIPRITTNQGMYNIRSQGTKPMNTGKHYYFVLLKSTSKLLRQWVPTFLLALQSYMKKFWPTFVHRRASWCSPDKSPGFDLIFTSRTALIFPGSTKSSNSRHSVVFTNSLAFCRCLFRLRNVLIQHRNKDLFAFLPVCL